MIFLSSMFRFTVISQLFTFFFAAIIRSAPIRNRHLDASLCCLFTVNKLSPVPLFAKTLCLIISPGWFWLISTGWPHAASSAQVRTDHEFQFDKFIFGSCFVGTIIRKDHRGVK